MLTPLMMRIKDICASQVSYHAGDLVSSENVWFYYYYCYWIIMSFQSIFMVQKLT